MGTGKPLRVIQYATGNIGRRALRTVIEHPGLSLVGLHVSSPAKAGQDAGTLCGLDPVGVTASDAIANLLATEADCVLYMRQGIDWDELCAILASGKNVVTTRGEFHNPAMMEPDKRAMIEAACAEGATSIYSTGSSPGFISEALPLAVLSCQRRFDGLTIWEFGDMTRRDSPEFIFDVLGYGKRPEDFATHHMHHIKEMFTGTLGLIADAVGMPVEEWTVGLDVALTTRDLEVVAGPLAKGTVGAQRITVEGLHRGKALMRFVAIWYVTTEVEPDWGIRETGWRVLVEGDAPMDMHIYFPVPLEAYTEAMPGYTAHRAVNAVEAVCAAPPGIRTTVDLPQVVARFS